MKFILLILFLSYSANINVDKTFVEKFADLAKYESKKTNVPASVFLALAIYESNSGQNELAQYANNYFNIICYSTTCKKGHCRTFENTPHKQYYRIYKSVWDNWDDEAMILKNICSGKNYKECCTIIETRLYPNNKNIATKLLKIIKQNNLTQYDK